MVNSIRVRLLAWYAVVLSAVVGGFAALLYYEVRAARHAEVDAHLETSAAALDAALRLFPPGELSSNSPPPRGDRSPPINNGLPAPPRERFLNELTLPGGMGEQYFAVWKPDGTLVKSSGLPHDTLRPRGAHPRPLIESRGPNRELIVLGPYQSVVLVGRPTQRVERDLAAFAWQLAATGFTVLAIGLAGGWVISRRIFRPVAAIAATASRISGRNLEERIDADRVDVELADLAEVLNGTFDRLQAAFDRQARFTADASHELRTPLTVIRSQAELALSRVRTPEEYQAALIACVRSAVRMTDLVERLLTLARADAGWSGLRREAVDLERVVLDAVAQIGPAAEKVGVTLRSEVEPARVAGDAAALGQVVVNLVKNAVQYNRKGGRVQVQVAFRGKDAALTVSDTGVGIPETDRSHVFERFYRVDRSRSRASGGTGLGLAICKSIVEAHGGNIGFDSDPQQGTTFWVTLPLLADE